MKYRTHAAFLAALAVAMAVSAPVASARHNRSEWNQDWDFLRQPTTGLVAAVREATARYRNVDNATMDGYMPVLGCVSSPNEGVMGVHYVKGSLLGDKTVDAAHPELLVYEPQRHGRMQLVAVEYLAFADDWEEEHGVGAPPVLMGQLFNYTGFPNRFGMEAHYSLHVWAWKYNPNGVFSMWNPRASCADFTSD